MDSLSFLIQNNNKVIVDQKLLQNLKNAQITQQLQSRCPAKSHRKYLPKVRSNRKRSQTIKLPQRENNKPSKLQYQKILNEEQNIQKLNAQITNLKQSQKKMQLKYNSIISTLQQQVNQRKLQYKNKCYQFSSLKNALIKTQKDVQNIASQFQANIFQNIKNNQPIQSPRLNKNNNVYNLQHNKYSKI